MDHQNGEPVRVLVTRDLAEEYRLYQRPTTLEPDIEDWLHWFPLAWAETGAMGLALHRAPVYVEIKAEVEHIKVRQYTMPLEAKRGITPDICRLLKLGVLKLTQSAQNALLQPVKNPMIIAQAGLEGSQQKGDGHSSRLCRVPCLQTSNGILFWISKMPFSACR